MQSEPKNLNLQLVNNNSTQKLGCYHCGSLDYTKAGHQKNGKQCYRCKRCNKNFIENPQPRKINYIPLSDDVWDARELGLQIDSHHSHGKLVFKFIKQDWLKNAVKNFIRYMAATRTVQTLVSYISVLNRFSNFLLEN